MKKEIIEDEEPSFIVVDEKEGDSLSTIPEDAINFIDTAHSIVHYYIKIKNGVGSLDDFNKYAFKLNLDYETVNKLWILSEKNYNKSKRRDAIEAIIKESLTIEETLRKELGTLSYDGQLIITLICVIMLIIINKDIISTNLKK